jgi:hypothetical protein
LRAKGLSADQVQAMQEEAEFMLVSIYLLRVQLGES